MKTHKGVHSLFHELTQEDPTFDSALRAFLSRSYNLKAVADYGTGPGSEISTERATEALQVATRFIIHVENALSSLEGNE